MAALWLILGVSIGLIIGFIGIIFYIYRLTVGDLIIAHSDNQNDPPNLLTNLNREPREFQHKKLVLMHVLNVTYKSQK